MNIKINPKNFYKVVISDMGTVTSVKNPEGSKGTPFFMPYESNLSRYDGEKIIGGKCQYSDKVDVYALGLIIAELHATGLSYTDGNINSKGLCGNFDVFDLYFYNSSFWRIPYVTL